MDEPVTMYLRASGPSEVTVADIEGSRPGGSPQPGLHLATLGDRVGCRDGTDRRARAAMSRPPQIRSEAGGPDPGRRHLLAGPQGDVQGQATRVEQRTDF